MTALRERFPAPAVMGILNVTPDSFSDGGEFLAADAAVAHARRLEADGADVVDVGGESTRPGAEPVTADEEIARVVPVVRALAATLGVPVSVDTSKAAVAEAALAAGATFVNDVTALRGDPALAGVVAAAGVPVCLMHMLGEPRTMQADPRYDDVVEEVRASLAASAEAAEAAGVDPGLICVDPGIGFGKTVAHNLTLLRRLDRIASLGYPVLLGVSRKRFLGAVTGAAGERDRVAGTVAANVLGFERGAWMFRVHDVAPTRQALAVAAAVARPEGAPAGA